MTAKITLDVPLNRVEGDLEVRIELNDGVVSDAWSSGTMFRGFERILVGRGALDGLVVTPRICGICSTAHLVAASRALDSISKAKITDNAKRVRNLASMTEHIQSDIRHGFLMFMTDFANPTYKNHSLHEEAVRRYQPFQGETSIEVLKETKRILEIVAILGGQWPHSSFMVPGGVVSNPTTSDLLQCRFLLKRYWEWYERRILGCSLERLNEIGSTSDLDVWIEESDAHRESELGFYIRFAKEAGFHKNGKGHGNFLSFGSLDMPENTDVKPIDGGSQFVPSGFAMGARIRSFDQNKVSEHVTYSWYKDYENGKHPYEGETKPYATGHEGKKYSWGKAPRYDEMPAETGPLAEMVISGHSLISEMVRRSGPNVFVRELARLIRPAILLPAMDSWIVEMIKDPGDFYCSPGEIVQGTGCGLTEATRGALGHWVKIEKGKIVQYQIITPTAWNASPRDSKGVRGPWEEALIGTEIKDVENPVEVGHVVRSFDACLVCTVHAIENGRTISRIML